MAAKSKSRKPGETKPREGRSGGGKTFKRKSCSFCKDKVREVDYKRPDRLRRFLTEKGRIRSPRLTGACRRHQRQLAVAVKRAREMALLPYVADPGPPSRSSRSRDDS